MAEQPLMKDIHLITEAEDPPASLAASKIRAYRRENGLTALELGEMLGVSEVAVLYWEKGRNLPRGVMQRKLQELDICSPNDWHELAPAANDDGPESGS